MQMWKPRLRKVQKHTTSSKRKNEGRTSSQSPSVAVTETGTQNGEWGEGCKWEEPVAGVWASGTW